MRPVRLTLLLVHGTSEPWRWSESLPADGEDELRAAFFDRAMPDLVAELKRGSYERFAMLTSVVFGLRWPSDLLPGSSSFGGAELLCGTDEPAVLHAFSALFVE